MSDEIYLFLLIFIGSRISASRNVSIDIRDARAFGEKKINNKMK